MSDETIPPVRPHKNNTRKSLHWLTNPADRCQWNLGGTKGSARNTISE